MIVALTLAKTVGMDFLLFFESGPHGGMDQNTLVNVKSVLNGGVLAEAAYQRAIGLFGQLGVEELIYLVGHYCFVSMTLNGFDILVPDDDSFPDTNDGLV